MTTSAIIAEMVLAALKRGAELTENSADDELVKFAGWLLNSDLVRTWLDGPAEAPVPLMAVPDELKIDPTQIAKWLPLIIELIATFRKLFGK